MKKLLFTFSILAAVLTSCDCKHGYGPNDCSDTWASNYAGTWSAEINCAGQLSMGNSTITEESATTIQIDGQIFATVIDWDTFTIPRQRVGDNDIEGQGKLIETTQTGVSGAIISGERHIEFSFDVFENGSYARTCNVNLSR